MSNYRVTPSNIKNGNVAPSFIVEAKNKEESKQAASSEFAERSSLAKYSQWELIIEKSQWEKKKNKSKKFKDQLED